VDLVFGGKYTSETNYPIKKSANTTSPVPEIIDRVFAKTSQNARFLLSENEHFGLVFVKTGSINSGTGNIAGSILYLITQPLK
jgi:hypothetical protein